MAKLYWRLIILITILSLPFHLEARKQVQASCSVRDGFLEIPLAEAKVTLLDADSVKIQDIEIVKFTEPDGRLLIAQVFVTLDCGKKYILHGTLDGYDDAWLDIDVPQDASAQINPGDLNFHRRQTTTLDGIVVKATKVKMVWKGDTLVYNADAFNLPKGSMLDDLIRQMPGVTMNDNGEIFVNGRKVDELLLGSKSFFRGKSEVLLRNLPYYTVKNIKVYDKQSEMSECDGRQSQAGIQQRNHSQRGGRSRLFKKIPRPCLPAGICRSFPFLPGGQPQQCEREPPHRAVGQLDSREAAKIASHHPECGR